MFDQCVAPFTDVEDMLISLAKIIEKQTPMISEILSVGKSLKDETSPEILTRSGAKLLMLLEPFLESLVPTQVKTFKINKVEQYFLSVVRVCWRELQCHAHLFVRHGQPVGHNRQ